MVNVIANIVETYKMLRIVDDINTNSVGLTIDVTYHELASSLGFTTLNPKAIQTLNATLNNLCRTQAFVYYTDGHDRFEKISTFLITYTMSATHIDGHRDIDKRISMTLNSELVLILLENKEIFSHLYMHARYDLRGKYATIIYDTITDQVTSSRTASRVFNLHEFVALVDFDLTSLNNINTWTKLNGNVLNRAVQEINTKTNLTLNYSKVKTRQGENSRTQTNAIHFDITLTPEIDSTSAYFTNEFLMERKVNYYIEREINRKIAHLTKLNEHVIKNEAAFRFKERQRLLNVREEFQARVQIQDYVNWAKYSFPGEIGLVIFKNLDKHKITCVTSDYKLINFETRQPICATATATHTKLTEFLAAGGHYALLDVENKKEYSISYSKG
jgi:plasmid replication initiation protein